MAIIENMFKKSIIVPLIVILIIAILIGAIIFVTSDNSASSVKNFTECAAKGYPVMESYPRRCAVPGGETFTEEINSPLGINVTSPKNNEELKDIITVEGEALGTWFFEAVFPISIEDMNRNTIASSFVTAEENWMTDLPVKFRGAIDVPDDFSGKAVLILKKDNPSGLPEKDSRVEIPISILASSSSEDTENISINVYFQRYGTDSSMDVCTKVFAAKRNIPKTTAVGKAAIEELLKGPTSSEKTEGYFTSINNGVSLESLSIKDGTAYADFDENLERSVGGSCRVLAIRTQIIETLKQFPTVKNVVISINNRTEDILQP